jgi:PAS domain S-box-containing protein
VERITVGLKISLQVKLVGAFLLTALVVVLLSYFNVQAIQQMRDSYTDLVENHTPRLNILQNMRVIAVQLDKEALLYESSQSSTATAERQKNSLLAGLDKLTDQEKDYQALIAKIENTAEEKELETNFKSVISSAKEQTVNAVFELIALKEQRASTIDIQAKETELEKAAAQLERIIASAIEQEQVLIDQENEETNAVVEQVTLLAIVGSVIASLFAVVMGLAISLSVVRNVNKLKIGSAKLAGGDFSTQIQVSSHDELGELATAFNKMSASLRSTYLRLELEKERDETLLESMSEGMIALDEHGKIVLINSVASSMFGLDPKAKDTSFLSSVSLLDEQGRAAPPESLPTSVLQSGETVDNVYTFQEDDTHKVLFDISASPIKIEGRIAGAILVIRNVTKEKEIDRMKTEFISLASHQLRTPLSAIKWFTEMLVSGDAGQLSPEQLEFAKNIDDSTERMIALVNALLNISRIESGRIMVDPKPTDLKELVSGIVNDLKAKTEEKQQTLLISVHQDLPKINLDPRLIGQVYLNLLTNAVKYTQNGGEISVFISKKDDQVISQITDNGYGIPKDQQDRLFQKFFRASNAVKVETDGTGLGLYLIKAVVESSGGKIWFESEENKGSTFWFSVPLSGMKPREGEVTLDV